MNAQEQQSFAVKNSQIVAALRSGSEYVYFKADQDYYSLVGVIIDGTMERIPAPVLYEALTGHDLVAEELDGQPANVWPGKGDIAAAIGRESVLVLDRNDDWQAGDRLLADICKALAAAEGGAWMDEEGQIVIHTTVSRAPSRRNNGGEYDYYRRYHIWSGGVYAFEDWSCDIQPCESRGTLYATAVDDLGPLLAQAEEIVREAQKANRTPFDAVAA